MRLEKKVNVISFDGATTVFNPPVAIPFDVENGSKRIPQSIGGDGAMPCL
jgi:hypothetical protein